MSMSFRRRTAPQGSAPKKILLTVAALLSASWSPAPAFADGGRRERDRHPEWNRHDDDYRADRHDYYGNRRHYYYGPHRRRGGLSGAEAAVIVAGVIGGAILIDRALSERDPYRRRDRRYDRDGGAFDDGPYYRRDDRYAAGEDDDWDAFRAGDVEDDDSGLLGGRERRPDAVYAEAAFRECVAETLAAAGAGGLLIAAPGAPSEVERLADGAVRMKAQFRAVNARGDEWIRRMVCEADELGVRFLQID